MKNAKMVRKLETRLAVYHEKASQGGELGKEYDSLAKEVGEIIMILESRGKDQHRDRGRLDCDNLDDPTTGQPTVHTHIASLSNTRQHALERTERPPIQQL